MITSSETQFLVKTTLSAEIWIGLDLDWTGMDLDYNELDLDWIRTVNRFINLGQDRL